MKRHETATLTPEAIRDLEALDRALAGTEMDVEHADIQMLVATVRNDAPRMRPAFAAQLDARVREGFANGGGVRARVRAHLGAASLRRHGLMAAGATLSAAIAAAIVIVAVGASGGKGPRGVTAISQTARPPAAVAPNQASPPATTLQKSAGQAAAPGALSAAPTVGAGGAGGAAGAAGRSVERDASLTLSAARGQVQHVADRVVAVTDRFGAIVQSSNVSVDDQGGSQADFILQIPSAKLDSALAAYSALAHVSSRNQSGIDITDETRATSDRLAAARAQRDALLRQLAKATTPNEVAGVRAQLGLVAGRIKQHEQALQSLHRRVRYATLQLTITEGRASSGGGAGDWGPDDALGSALDVLRATGGVLVVAAASLVPLAALALPAWWALVGLRRRRREQVLGPIV